MLETCDGLSEREAHEYLAVRKAKRAGPASETSWRAIEREATKAGITFLDAVRKCIEKGWVGFDADWINKTIVRGTTPVVDFRAKRKAEEDAVWEEFMNGKPTTDDFIEGEFQNGN